LRRQDWSGFYSDPTIQPIQRASSLTVPAKVHNSSYDPSLSGPSDSCQWNGTYRKTYLNFGTVSAFDSRSSSYPNDGGECKEGKLHLVVIVVTGKANEPGGQWDNRQQNLCVCVLGSFENNDQDPEHFGGQSRARVSLY
jgi:hypothetical protein